MTMPGERIAALAIFASLAGWVVLAATPAAAQTGAIEARILDATGRPLAGATVEISSALGHVKTTAIRSGDDGVAEFPVLRAASGYAIRVSAPGFGEIVREAIRVPAGERVRLSLRLMPAIAERVRVTAERPVIDLDNSESVTRFGDELLEDLPLVGRDPLAAALLVPGVRDADGDGNPNVHGSRSRDFRPLVGGVSNVDPLTGRRMSRVNPNSVESLEVIAAGAGVEFGRAQGGFARVVQKQGSNRHEGVAELFWRTSAFDGESASARYTGLPQPDLDWLQPALHLSGPIVRDRLWYRASHELRRIEQPTPGLSGGEVSRLDEATHSDQLTWQASPRNKLALRFDADPRRADNYGVTTLTAPGAGRRLDGGSRTWALDWTAPSSPRLLVDSGVAWQELESGEFPAREGVPNQCAISPAIVADAYCEDLETSLRSGSWYRHLDDRRQRLTVRSKAVLHRTHGRGASQLTFGLRVENERYHRDLRRDPSFDMVIVGAGEYDPTGTVFFPAFFPYGVGWLRIAVPQTDRTAARGTAWAVFVEEQYRPRDNVVVTAGLRIEREELDAVGVGTFDPRADLARFDEAIAPWIRDSPGFVDTVIGQIWPEAFTSFDGIADVRVAIKDTLCDPLPLGDRGACRAEVDGKLVAGPHLKGRRPRRPSDISLRNTNFAPRLSLSWSPGGDGRTALRVSAGRHFNTIPLVVPLQEQEPALVDLTYFVDLFRRLAGSTGNLDPTANVRIVDRELRTPYQDEWFASFEREILPETSIRVSWIRRRFRDQIQDTNLNLATGDEGACHRITQPGERPIEPSPGAGQTLIDAYSGTAYVDTDPGDGDGLLDNCVGRNEFAFSATDGFFIATRPDDTIDLYVQNPLWGDVLEVSNTNRIDYTAYQLEIVRRRNRNWELQASYTWSKATGDGEDFFQELADDPSLLADVPGRQSYDQRHVARLTTATRLPWGGLRLGAALSWESGLPYSSMAEIASFDTVPPLIGRFAIGGSRIRRTYRDASGPLSRNTLENPDRWNLDVRVAREMTLSRGATMQLSLELFNALDDDGERVYDPARGSGTLINGRRETTRRYGRQWQLGTRIAF